jgi:hypothetical protein
MPLRSIRLRFLALVLVATAAACAAHPSGGMLPSSPFAMRAATATPTPKPSPIPHAACTIRSGFIAPFVGALVVETAFGQLETVSGTRSAASGVDLGTTRLHAVRAAQGGRVRYYAAFRGYQNVAVVTAKSGVQMLYAPLYFPKKKVPRNRNIRSGADLGKAATRTLHFEITDGTDPSDPENEQLNPCGDADGASGTISIVASPGVNVTFSTFSLDGIAFPTSAPGGMVSTPVVMSVDKVGPLHGWGFGTTEFGVTAGSFNIVLCGNVVFQTGDPRFSVTIPVTGTTPTLPKLVFFRDAGSSASTPNLSENLPPQFTRPCPAAPPVAGSTYALLMTVGQIAQGTWTTSDATQEWMSMTSSSPAIASVSPSASPGVPILTTAPPYPPPLGDYYTITANAPGTAVITDINTATMVTAAPISVTVRSTPTIAPWPTPMPNSTTTPAPTPSSSTSPSPSPSASP